MTNHLVSILTDDNGIQQMEVAFEVRLALENVATGHTMYVTEDEAADWGAEVADGSYRHVGFSVGYPLSVDGSWCYVNHTLYQTKEAALVAAEGL